MSSRSYESYAVWCRQVIGVEPASEEHYEKVGSLIKGTPVCAVCAKHPVKVFGNTCGNCIMGGQAANPKVRG